MVGVGDCVDFPKQVSVSHVEIKHCYIITTMLKRVLLAWEGMLEEF